MTTIINKKLNIILYYLKKYLFTNLTYYKDQNYD